MPAPLPASTFSVRQAIKADARAISDFLVREAKTQPVLRPRTTEEVENTIAKASEPGAGRYYICVEKATGEIVGIDVFCDIAKLIIEEADRASNLGVEVGTIIECDHVPMLAVKSGVNPKTYLVIAALLTLKAKDIQAEGKLHEYLWVQGAMSCQGATFIRQLGSHEKQEWPGQGDWVVRWERAFQIAEQVVR